MKILVCDDDKSILSIIRFKLSRENLGEVVTAGDGREAIELLRLHEFDLIITDINMPFNSGLEVTTYIRKKLLKKTPILILSAEGLEDTVLQAFELGADDFVAKPFSLSELVLRVKRLIR